MPRGPRLDAPGVLHPVMARGIERQRIFQDDGEREDFVQRLAKVAAPEALRVYAWALLPNHLHLLVRTGGRPVARSMRSRRSGYAGAYNRRYRRSGHLCQNRYKRSEACIVHAPSLLSNPFSPISSPGSLLLSRVRQRRKIVHQHPMDKDVPSTNFP
jgi:REP element-mobilizing transposase RayT